MRNPQAPEQHSPSGTGKWEASSSGIGTSRNSGKLKEYPRKTLFGSFSPKEPYPAHCRKFGSSPSRGGTKTEGQHHPCWLARKSPRVSQVSIPSHTGEGAPPALVHGCLATLHPPPPQEQGEGFWTDLHIIGRVSLSCGCTNKYHQRLMNQVCLPGSHATQRGSQWVPNKGPPSFFSLRNIEFIADPCFHPQIIFGVAKMAKAPLVEMGGYWN